MGVDIGGTLAKIVIFCPNELDSVEQEEYISLEQLNRIGKLIIFTEMNYWIF